MIPPDKLVTYYNPENDPATLSNREARNMFENTIRVASETRERPHVLLTLSGNNRFILVGGKMAEAKVAHAVLSEVMIENGLIPDVHETPEEWPSEDGTRSQRTVFPSWKIRDLRFIQYTQYNSEGEPYRLQWVVHRRV